MYFLIYTNDVMHINHIPPNQRQLCKSIPAFVMNKNSSDFLEQTKLLMPDPYVIPLQWMDNVQNFLFNKRLCLINCLLQIMNISQSQNFEGSSISQFSQQIEIKYRETSFKRAYLVTILGFIGLLSFLVGRSFKLISQPPQQIDLKQQRKEYFQHKNDKQLIEDNQNLYRDSSREQQNNISTQHLTQNQSSDSYLQNKYTNLTIEKALLFNKNQSATFIQNEVSSISIISNLIDDIQRSRQKITALKNEKNLTQCRHLSVYDDYNFSDDFYYYLGAYDLFLKGCNQNKTDLYGVHNENIKIWNQRRETIEWALRNLADGDKVHVNIPYNLLTLIILSKLVGQKGWIVWEGINLENLCLKNNLQLYKIANIKAFSEKQDFNVFIGESEKLEEKYQSLVKQKEDIKLFFFLKSSDSLENLIPKANVEQYLINSLVCGQIFITNQTEGPGYYSITNLNFRPLEQIAFPKIEMPVSLKIQQNYQRYLSYMLKEYQEELSNILRVSSSSGCIDPRFNRKLENLEMLTVYNTRLYNISEVSLLQWEKSRQPVQWIRFRTKINSSVYYEMVASSNILAIIQISRLIKKGNLTVKCTGSDCSIIQSQVEYFSLNNVKIIKEDFVSVFEKILKNQYVITDNEKLIFKLSQSDFFGKGHLLAKFDESRKESLKTFAKLIPNYKLDLVRLLENVCQGFEYENYFWSTKDIRYFYEVSPSSRYIFMYWGGSPDTVPFRRKHFLEKQSVLNTGVQIKIINSKLFVFMGSSKFPIHETYTLLSEVHRSDYARSYLMYVYGGGYSDTKHLHYDWNPYFEELENNPKIYAVGYHEIRPQDVACFNQVDEIPCNIITGLYNNIIGNAMHIYKKQSEASFQIIKRIHAKLEMKKKQLKQNPPRHARDQVWLDGFSKYPIRWAEINGQIRSRVCYKQMDKYNLSMPLVLTTEYRTLTKD